MKNLVYNLAIFWQIFAIPIVPNITPAVVSQKPLEPGIIMPVFPKIDKLAVSHIQPLQPIEPIQVAPVAVPAPNTADSTANMPSGGCVIDYSTGDYYLDKIINFESGPHNGGLGGGNSCIHNYLGCFGLLQACPGAPLEQACGGDPDCQIAWFRANKTGGRSWAEVWQHELTYGWW